MPMLLGFWGGVEKNSALLGSELTKALLSVVMFRITMGILFGTGNTLCDLADIAIGIVQCIGYPLRIRFHADRINNSGKCGVLICRHFNSGSDWPRGSTTPPHRKDDQAKQDVTIKARLIDTGLEIVKRAKVFIVKEM